MRAVELVGGEEEDGEDEDVLEDLCSNDGRREVVLETLFSIMTDDSRDNSKDD